MAMKRKWSGRTRADYMSLIYEYSRRMDKYEVGSAKRLQLSIKVNRFKRQLRRINEKNTVYTTINGKQREIPKQLRLICSQSEEFFQRKIKGSRVGESNAPFPIELNIFCKYAMEQGFYSRDVSFLIGSTSPQAAYVARRKTNRMFKKDDSIKASFHQYKNHMDKWMKEINPNSMKMN